MEQNVEFINLTPENLADEHLCCIIRTRKKHPGVEAKRQWLAERLKEGHVFRKLNQKCCVMIEYAPLETAWVPVEGENYLYIYCLWVDGKCKSTGTAEHCWNTAWRTPKPRASPACVCWGRRNRRRG